MEVNEYFDNLAAPMKEIALSLRALIKAQPVKLEEAIKWNVPTYSHHKIICSIMAHKHHVNLQFFTGAKLPHSEQLRGSGKLMRHLSFNQVDDIEPDVINQLLKEAVDYDAQQI